VSEEFIGAGWGFPVRTDAIGGVALVSREREIDEAIRLILGTAVGERPMRPEFGCRIHEYVFAPADATTFGLIAYDVRAALLRWEPRIEVTDVTVTPDPDDPSTLYITVDYTIPRSNDPRNLVFPFYTIPEEQSALPTAAGGEE
jgi:Bacteriophage baseplate protein W